MSHLPSSFDGAEQDVDDMTFYEKMVYHCKQQPLVPLGTLATTVAVILAAQNVRTGNKRNAQKYFRWRVGLQGATLVALVAGSFIYGKSEKDRISKEDELREKAKLREKLWIQELERRDDETKQRKLRAEMARAKALELNNETLGLQAELKKLQSQNSSTPPSEGRK
ncbi:LANO_0H12046g1_1 [Lachancea nothofagi CBS 11611]|uniref:Respiratory supercomplex factor 1, mitochondrial n=1 Tax=Lachancea nothofagi CBS 11611 TaxID=1266666 RepID=A0A1G4KML4_9SACH|nr:LANO_0H12046g1_1 [Lachancea nothofagi CBS 11611]